MRMPSLRLVAPLALLLVWGCKKEEPAQPAMPPPTAEPAKPPPPPATKVGLVTDVGGRGDQSFNDSALRGLELWSAGKKYTASGYQDASPEEVKQSLSADLASRQPPISPVKVEPV